MVEDRYPLAGHRLSGRFPVPLNVVPGHPVRYADKVELPFALYPRERPGPTENSDGAGSALVIVFPITAREQLVSLGCGKGFHAVARTGPRIANELNDVVRAVEHLVELGSATIV